MESFDTYEPYDEINVNDNYDIGDEVLDEEEQEEAYEDGYADFSFEERRDEIELNREKYGDIAKSENGWEVKRVINRKVEILHFDSWHWLQEAKMNNLVIERPEYWCIKNLDNSEKLCEVGAGGRYDDDNWEKGYIYPPLFHVGTVTKGEDEEFVGVSPLPYLENNKFNGWKEAHKEFNNYEIKLINEKYDDFSKEIEKGNMSKDYIIDNFINKIKPLDNVIINDDDGKVYSQRGIIIDVSSKEAINEILKKMKENENGIITTPADVYKAFGTTDIRIDLVNKIIFEYRKMKEKENEYEECL